MKRFIKKLFTKTLNDAGSVLSVSLILFVVLASSAAAITSITINQSQATSVKLDSVNDEVTGKRLIQRAIADYEAFMIANNDFDLYDSDFLADAEITYSVDIRNVTDEFDGFGVVGFGESRVYRFAYALNNGTDLVMYSYISTVGSQVAEFDPFDFNMGTNGDLVLTGGYYTNAQMFGKNLYFNYRGPYINKISGVPQVATVTPSSSGYYPDFQGNGNNLDIFVTEEYLYCTDNCFDTNGINDPFVINKDEYVDIEGSGLETGDFDQDLIINNFFGDFSYETRVLDFVTDVGPTNARVITDPITLDTIGDVVAANSGPDGIECFLWWCWPAPSTEPYTDITNDTDFDPTTDDEYLLYGAYYDGDLEVNRGLHMWDRDEEALVIDGDLIINNDRSNALMLLDGKFVITGDLIFNGYEVDIDGAFYVMGQVIFDFEPGYGVSEQGSAREYGLTILARDNIILKSMWENHTNGRNRDSFDGFWYTEESIYLETVNNRLNFNGSIYANAKGESGNYIPVEDQDGNPILGIVITSYRGYINNAGNAVPNSNRNREGFIIDLITSQVLQDAHVEIIQFSSWVTMEGEVAPPERSGFFYEEPRQ
jgi:hypothetical protein